MAEPPVPPLEGMPSDALAEALSRCDPADLARLAASSRSMRALLAKNQETGIASAVWKASLTRQALLSKRELAAVGVEAATRLDDAWRRKAPTGNASLTMKHRLAASPDAEGALLCGGVSVRVSDGARGRVCPLIRWVPLGGYPPPGA